MSDNPGKVVNKKELAQLFGVSVQAIDGMLGRGLPYLKKGANLQSYEFDSAQCIAWRTQREVERALAGKGDNGEPDDFKRKLAAEASLAELKLAREAAQLIALEDVETVWSKMVSNLRAKLLSIPAKMAPLAHTAESVEESQDILERALHEALNELADGHRTEDQEPSDSPSCAPDSEPEGDGDDQAAAETLSQ